MYKEVLAAETTLNIQHPWKNPASPRWPVASEASTSGLLELPKAVAAQDLRRGPGSTGLLPGKASFCQSIVTQ